MAHYKKRPNVKRYRRSFYSREMKLKKGIGIAVLVLSLIHIFMANEKILVVDDDTNICELLRLYLTKEGYQVTTANDGEEGLEKFSQGTVKGSVVKQTGWRAVYGEEKEEITIPGWQEGDKMCIRDRYNLQKCLSMKILSFSYRYDLYIFSKVTTKK